MCQYCMCACFCTRKCVCVCVLPLWNPFQSIFLPSTGKFLKLRRTKCITSFFPFSLCDHTFPLFSRFHPNRWPFSFFTFRTNFDFWSFMQRLDLERSMNAWNWEIFHGDKKYLLYLIQQEKMQKYASNGSWSGIFMARSREPAWCMEANARALDGDLTGFYRRILLEI